MADMLQDLLIELFSEEIPARMQGFARDTLKKMVTEGLVEAGLTYAGAEAFSTPRRLTLVLTGLSGESPTLTEERKGPATTAPEKALEGFLRSTGLSKDQLEIRDDKKGQAYFAKLVKPGRKAPEIVAEVVERTIRTFPWPKAMRWGTGTLKWVRPLHSIVCLLTTQAGHEVVPFEVEGIAAGDTTEGHRFMAPGRFAVTGFEDYAQKLKAAKVVLDAREREEIIHNEAKTLAFARGFELVEDRGLLTELAGLVEWPVPLMGEIAPEFLGLPPEVLQTSMKEHQKFFSVRNPATGRIEAFITVANRETVDTGATILKGNLKVLSARLSDARFFWEHDLRLVKAGGLSGMAEGLAHVTFHNKLGSQAERVGRIAALAHEIAPMVSAAPDLAELAARVVKADLRSAMVGEFPELQGLMGSYYARAEGLPEAVAAACKGHYSPLGPSDEVPSEPVTVAVALADKLDTLTGFWAIDEKPTGSKDPFALRRAALGVIRLVLVNGLRLPLLRLFATANAKADAGDLLSFFHDRLKVFLKDQNIRHDVIDAVLTMPGNDDLTLVVKRAEALAGLLKTDDGENLIQGFRRANNILAQAEAKDGVEYSYGADAKFAEAPEEKALFAALDQADAAIGPAMKAEDFATAMTAMAGLRAPIDAFFTAVQINSDNAVVRRNRLNLLSRIRQICLEVADLARIEG